jgi:tRNA (cmo5U34)-methyltransferase
VTVFENIGLKATYLGRIRTEVPAYDELQDALADSTAGIQAERVLELGVGTGETSRRVLDLAVLETR